MRIGVAVLPLSPTPPRPTNTECDGGVGSCRWSMARVIQSTSGALSGREASSVSAALMSASWSSSLGGSGRLGLGDRELVRVPLFRALVGVVAVLRIQRRLLLANVAVWVGFHGESG